MNRLVGFALVGGFLASSAAASAAGANLVAPQGNAHFALPAVQQPLTSVEQPVPAPAPTLAPAIPTRGTLQAFPPGAAELAPASQAALSPCTPARTEVACRKP